MAYVLVVVGALMAAAGLYTIGYSVLNARFDEYWIALSAGATLVAGGTVTVALGAAIRALSQLKAGLTQPLAPLSNGAPAANGVAPVADTVAPAADGVAPPYIDIASSDGVAAPPAVPQTSRTDLRPPEMEAAPPIDPVEAEPDVVRRPPPLPGSVSRVPPPLRQTPPPLPARPPLLPDPIRPAVAASTLAAAALEPPAQRHIDTPMPGAEHTAHHVAEERREEDHFAYGAEPDIYPTDEERHSAETARPADDYKLETPSTPEHDLPALEPSRPHVAPPSGSTPDMPDDWLDRAFAELDEELPISRPANRNPTPVATHQEPSARPAGPDLAPVMAEPERDNPESAHVAAEAPAAPPPLPAATPSARPTPPVIGRYEADGTSYVMYADGSIEAQSSSGVYRFASMAELKSFIEN